MLEMWTNGTNVKFAKDSEFRHENRMHLKFSGIQKFFLTLYTPCGCLLFYSILFQIDARCFSCVCLLIDDKLRHNIVKVAVEPRAAACLTVLAKNNGTGSLMSTVTFERSRNCLCRVHDRQGIRRSMYFCNVYPVHHIWINYFAICVIYELSLARV